MKKPAKNHPGSSGCLVPFPTQAATLATGAFYRPQEDPSPVKTLSPAEIEELGLELVIPVAEILEARRMCQQLHLIAVATPKFQYWKEKLDRLKRKVRR